MSGSIMKMTKQSQKMSALLYQTVSRMGSSGSPTIPTLYSKLKMNDSVQGNHRAFHASGCNRKSLGTIHGSDNYFSLFGVSESFDLDEKELKKTFRQLQTEYHPDKSATKSKESKEASLEQSTTINKAYNVLLHPIKRAEYILSLRGHSLQEDEITMESDFLMEIMEINEKLVEIKDAESINKVSKQNAQIIANLIKEASEHFGVDDMVKAKMVVAKMKYYNNIYEKIKELEIKHEIVH